MSPNCVTFSILLSLRHFLPLGVKGYPLCQ